MKKLLLIFSLLLGTCVYAKQYTLVFSNVKNKENANHFIKKHLKYKKDVQIIKYKKRYRVTYGKFKTRKEAYLFKSNLNPKLKKIKPFLMSLKSKKYTSVKKAPKKLKKIKPLKSPLKNKKIIVNTAKNVKKVKEKKRFIFPKKYNIFKKKFHI
ncbi:MAG: SPOR domain-containing protein [Arcobacter sp.]|nr:SPOR domain-containing protein [Arcobacter sp.]